MKQKPKAASRAEESRPLKTFAVGIALTPDVYESKAATRTDEASLKLVEMENRAFELVRQDKRDAATELLFSEEYENQKELYADGMTKLDAALGRNADEQIGRNRGRVLWMGSLSLLVVVVLILGWIAVYIAVRTHLRRRVPAEEALRGAEDYTDKVIRSIIDMLVVVLDGLRRMLRAERDRWELNSVGDAEGVLARAENSLVSASGTVGRRQ